MQRFALGQEFPVAAPYLIDKSYTAAADLTDSGANGQVLVVEGGLFVATVGLGDHHKGVVLILHLFIGKTTGSAEIAPTGFEPDQVVGMMYDAHLVRFSVTDTDLSFVPFVHKIG